jgi:hypothetical protein
MFGPFTCARTVPAQHTDHCYCYCYRNTCQSSSDTVVTHSDRTNHRQQLSSSIFVFNFLLISEMCGTEPQIGSLAMKCREGQTTLSLNCERTLCRPLDNVTSLHYYVHWSVALRRQHRHFKKSSTVTQATNLLRTQ